MHHEKDFSILLFTSDPVTRSLCEGYSYLKNCDLIVIDGPDEFERELAKDDQPKLVIVDLTQVLIAIKNNQWGSIGKLLEGRSIIACGLNRNQLFDDLIKDQGLNTDAFFTLPLDVEQLDKYISRQFYYSNEISYEQDLAETRFRLADRRKLPDRRYHKDRRTTQTGRRQSTDRRERNDRHMKRQDEIKKRGRLIDSVLTIDNHLKCAYLNGKTILLARKEFEFLSYIANKPDDVSLNEDIIGFLWPKKEYAVKTELHQYVHLLRKKIENNPRDPKILVTVKGFGYRLGCASIVRN